MGFLTKVKDAQVLGRKEAEALYSAALREVESGIRRDGLWAKAVTESRGDQHAVKARYMTLVIQAMRDEMYIAGRIAEAEAESVSSPPDRIRKIPQALVPAITVANEHSFFKRAWLMLLFVASLAMLLGVFPYQAFVGSWRWSYLAVLGFWLGVGHYSYTSLFCSQGVAAEQRHEREKRRSIQPNTLKGLLVGASSGAVAFVLFAVFVANDPNSQMSVDLFVFGFFVFVGAIVGGFGLRR